MSIGSRTLGAIAVTVLLLAGCGTDPPDRAAVLADLADTDVVPGYVAFATAATELEQAVTTLCEGPDHAALDAARAALASARARWKATEALWVGPVMERRSWAVIDWPIAEPDIEELITDDTIVLDLDRLSRRIGADQRGLRAVEYILGPDGDDGETLAELADPRRCAYLTGIVAVVVDEAELLVPDWTETFEEGPAYAEVFADGGDGLDAVINDALFLLEAMSDAELGQALGLMEDDADPDAVIEGAAALGVADLENRLLGLRRAIVGDDESAGISPLLDDDLTGRLIDQFDEAAAALEAVDPPLSARVESDPVRVIAARDALTALQVTIATEVVSALGVTIGFSDADGDSG